MRDRSPIGTLRNGVRGPRSGFQPFGDQLEALYVLAITTGMRRGELPGLKWSDVDLEEVTLSVRQTLTRTRGGKDFALGEPKTKRSQRPHHTPHG
jgi:integrase